MSHCSDAVIHIDWQFNAYAQEGDIHVHSPLNALNYYRGAYRYDTRTGNVIPDSGAENGVMNLLRHGQPNNQDAQNSYTECRAAHRSIHAFMRLVCSARGTSNFQEVVRHIEWQRENDRDSLTNSWDSWETSTRVQSADGKDYYAVIAMFRLMRGQRQTASVMQLYRGCFRGDPARLFALVRG